MALKTPRAFTFVRDSYATQLNIVSMLSQYFSMTRKQVNENSRNYTIMMCYLHIELFADPEKKYNFNVRLNLIPSQPFVQCGSFLDLCYSTRNIVVKINPAGLKPGVHSAV